MNRTFRAAQFACVLLAVAAVVNVAAGAWMSLTQPWRASDLWVMDDWCRDWLRGGQSLYTGPESSTDYPPNAIVLLSPMAFVPHRWLVPLWTAGAVALTPVLPWLVFRSASRHRGAALAVPVLMFLCWAATRTLLQFSLLSMVLACVALVIVDSHWLAAGVALGLGLMKPHIAGPIALWMLVSGRIRSLVAAGAVVAGGWVIYDARIGEGPLTTTAGYWHALGSQYAGADGLVGRTSIRGWLRLMIADAGVSDSWWIALAALLLIGIVALAAHDRRRSLEAGGLAIPALFCMWSLLAIYHNGNNLILMLPAFAFLWCLDDRVPGPRRWAPILALQAALMFDVPLRLGGAVSPGGWASVVIAHFDRAAVLMMFVWVSVRWYRLTRVAATG